MTTFAHELHTAADHCRLILHDGIDLAVRDELRASLRDVVAASMGVTEVDLQDVTFLDCTGIGLLVAANNTAHQRGDALIVTHPWGIVRRVLEITDVLPYLSAPPVQAHRHRLSQ